MKKKGFTLIELLAVIVILAIIMVIAVPQILNAIENSRKSAAVSSALMYIRAIDYNNKFADMNQPGYTKITSGNVSEINVNIKGEGPTSGSVTINDAGKVSAATLCIQQYTVTYNGSSATVGNKCGAPAPAPVAFATDSWETIAANQTSSVYNVGDLKELVMDVNDDGVDETYHIQLVNKTACTTETSQTACGMVLQFKELLNITNDDNRKMNLTNTSAGGWPATSMRTYLNETIYNKIPNDLKGLITTTTVISGYESGKTANYTSQDKLYLISTKEIGHISGAWFVSLDSETRQLDYYVDQATRLKYSLGGWSETYWLRDAVNNMNDTFCMYFDGGVYSNYASTPMGVTPAFRLNSN